MPADRHPRAPLTLADPRFALREKARHGEGDSRPILEGYARERPPIFPWPVTLGTDIVGVNLPDWPHHWVVRG